MSGKIVKYLVRKPAQAIGGAIAGFVICSVPGVILMGINDSLAPAEPIGSTGPFQKWPVTPTEITMYSVIIGLFGGAGLGLYL